MDFIELITKKLALETIVANLFIVAAAIYFAWFKKKYPAILQFFSRHGLLLAFLTALGATGASLFYSQVVGFPPCELCWWQRIFMYPLVIIIGLALVKKDRNIIDYALYLSYIGFAISLYHNFIYYYNGGLNAPCLLGEFTVSCVKRYVFEFGYVTIPVMSLTAFVLIIMFLFIAKMKNNAK